MHNTVTNPVVKPGLLTRIWTHPFVRAVVGIVLTFAPIPLTMIAAQALVEKPYRVVWPQLLAALLTFLAYRFFAHRIEKRSLTELTTNGALRETGQGVLLGAGLVAGTFLLLGVAGVYQLNGINQVGLTLLWPLAEMILVGMAEEMVFRGVVFRITENAIGSRWAIAISALLFGLVHVPNDGGLSIVPIAGVIAYGVLQAAIYMCTRRLWLCIGGHVAWNYCVGQIFSSTVSGHSPEVGLLRGQLSGNTLLTGGQFGVEGSVITLLLICATAVYFLRRASSLHRFVR